MRKPAISISFIKSHQLKNILRLKRFLFLLLLAIIFHGAAAENNGDDHYPAVNVYPLDTHYHRPGDLLPELKEKKDQYPHLTDWYIIGESSNHKLPIYALRITNKETREAKPKVLFHGQHHSEEVIGVEIVMHMINHFLNKYEKEDFITYLIDNYELWFIPTSNPEGFKIVNSGEFRLKRKNETDSNMNGIRELNKDGVDLNRNYPFNWDKDEAKNPESPYYKGLEAACQSETQAMMYFYEQQKFDLAFFYHSSATGTYSERIFYPWIWNNEYSPDYRELSTLANVLATNLPRAYESGFYNAQQRSTSMRGFARDYIYSQHRTLSMLIEVGGNSPYGEGVLSPPNEVLRFIQEKHTKAMLKLLQEFDNNLLSVSIIDQDNNPLPGREVIIEGRESPHTNNIITCDQGYFFSYLTAREEPYNFIIGKDSFSFLKTERRKDEFVFKLNISGDHDKAYIEELTGGEAIIMTNTVFQHLPSLTVAEDHEKAYISLLDGFSINYRTHSHIHNNQLSIPWIPVDISKRGILTAQARDIHPLLDEKKTANKIFFLEDEKEMLTYCLDKSSVNHFYLHPSGKIAVNYSLHPAGPNDFYIAAVKIHGDSTDKDHHLNVSLYDGATPLTTAVAQYKGNAVESLAEIPFGNTVKDNIFYAEIASATKLPDNLNVIIANKSGKSVAIPRDKIDYVNAERTKVYYSEWNPLSGADLAVEIILKKDLTSN